jgi:hypothetical protein
LNEKDAIEFKVIYFSNDESIFITGSLIELNNEVFLWDQLTLVKWMKEVCSFVVEFSNEAEDLACQLNLDEMSVLNLLRLPLSILNREISLSGS